MPLTGVHILLALRCIEECDHCFLWSSPESMSVMSLAQVKEILSESKKLGTVNHIYVEGGEPFLYYPVMLETLKMAKKMGLDLGVVTNCYWATDYDDALLWLKPIAKIGLMDLGMSADIFHWGDLESERARYAAKAAHELGLPGQIMAVESDRQEKVDSIEGIKVGFGGIMYKGRAAVNLAKDAPKRPWKEFDECPYENLKDPGRVHVDPQGYVHACQGLCIGNMFETPFSEIISKYDYKKHPLIRPLAEGGPVALLEELGISREDEYADACHFCYDLRSKVRERYPDILCPKEVYGEYD